MKIAIDLSPLSTGNFLQHRVRGSGFYLTNLRSSLEKYSPKNQYVYFKKGEKVNADIYHYPYFEPFFLTLPFSIGKRSTVTVHDLTPLVFANEFPTGTKGKLKWIIQKYLLKKTGAIITDSVSSQKDIARITGITEQKIFVVYLAAGEDFKVIKNEQKLKEIAMKYNLPDKFALYVGDVTWNKNLPRIVEALKKTNIPLVMVGKTITDEKYDRSNLWNKDLIKVQELIRNDKQFMPLGFVETEELAILYNLATVFVMPSLYEGFGLPILEAMACGCPVVTSTRGSLKEVAGEAVAYVDPQDTRSITDGILSVYNSPDVQEILSKKGILQSKKFSWKSASVQTVQVYEKVVAG